MDFSKGLLIAIISAVLATIVGAIFSDYFNLGEGLSRIHSNYIHTGIQYTKPQNNISISNQSAGEGGTIHNNISIEDNSKFYPNGAALSRHTNVSSNVSNESTSFITNNSSGVNNSIGVTEDQIHQITKQVEEQKEKLTKQLEEQAEMREKQLEEFENNLEAQMESLQDQLGNMFN